MRHTLHMRAHALDKQGRNPALPPCTPGVQQPVVTPPRAEATPQQAQQAEQGHFGEPGYYRDPHHLANVDAEPMSTDPGDLGR